MFLIVIEGNKLYRYKGRECVNIAEVAEDTTAEEIELFRVYGFD